MNAIQAIITSIVRQADTADDEDLVLGLPLESGDRTIYPVFLAPSTTGSDGAQPRQIGYLELGEDSSEYTSLERDKRAVLLVPTIIALLGFLAWLLVRLVTARRR